MLLYVRPVQTCLEHLFFIFLTKGDTKVDTKGDNKGDYKGN